jgi:tetratricopeptide (TPR) repeat protein
MTAPDPSYDQAVKLATSGRLAEAADVLGSVLQGDPDFADGWRLMAALQRRLGSPVDVLRCYAQIVRLAPDDPDAHLTQGNLLGQLGQTAQALVSYDRAAALAPGMAYAHNNRANMLNKLDRPAEALAAADRAIALDPRLVHAWRHRAQALSQLDQTTASIAAYQSALDVAGPADRGEVLTDMARVLGSVGRYDEAIAALDTAVGLEGDVSTALLCRGELRLLSGDFAGGWGDYEARLQIPNFLQANRRFTPAILERLVRRPSRDDFAGRRVLVLGEQAFGDAIMFASTLGELAALAASVTCAVDERLVRLLRESLPNITFTSAQVDGAGFDVVVAMGSLPGAFRQTREAYPGRPYLTPSPGAIQRWQTRLPPAAGKLRVGVSWRGGLARTRAAARSMDLEVLEPLLTLPHCSFVSLQYGEVDAEVAAINARLPTPLLSFAQAETRDFDDLAGLAACLDVVVTVQTTLAHLCGALGKTAFVMIPRWPEWRYGLEGEEMAWYASLRLIRQGSPGDWGSVIGEVGRRLHGLRSGPRSA